MNTTTRRAAVLAWAALLGLGACSDSSEGPPPTSSSTNASPSATASTSSPAASSSPSVSPSGSADAPTIPEVARARTAAGAIAFLRFFVDEVNRGQTTPGSVNLFTVSDKDCIACKKIQASLDEYVEKGWSTKQAPVKIHSPALANTAADERVIINFTFEQRPVAYYKGGKEQGTLQPAKTRNAAALRWIAGAWQMYGMEQL